MTFRGAHRARGARPPSRRQGGFALIGAIFVIVVLALLGTFAVRVGAGEEQTAGATVIELRAQQAALAGIEYGANQALINKICLPTKSLNLDGALNGFVVLVTCNSHPHSSTLPTSPLHDYVLDSTATQGTYGSPDYVARHVTRTFTDAP